jgi:hypothetical protein
MGMEQLSESFLGQKVEAAKIHFERALACKHTEFDDLYPYMLEHPQFFWYKRYVAWSELLTLVQLSEELNYAWKDHFSDRQISYMESRVMSGEVLDTWAETVAQNG